MKTVRIAVAAIAAFMALFAVATASAMPAGDRFDNKTETQACVNENTGATEGTFVWAGPTASWPPNHKDKSATVSLIDGDGDPMNDVTLVVTWTHDEIVEDATGTLTESQGSGSTPFVTDASGGEATGTEGKASTPVRWRSERAGTEDGRTYTFTADGTVDGTPTLQDCVPVTFTVDPRPRQRLRQAGRAQAQRQASHGEAPPQPLAATVWTEPGHKRPGSGHTPGMRVSLPVLAVLTGVLVAPTAADAALPRLTRRPQSRDRGERGHERRSGACPCRRAARTVSVRFATRVGSASVTDFVQRSGTLRVRGRAVGDDDVLKVRGDAFDEPDERFTLRLSKPRNARLGTRRTATITIVDDDLPAVPDPQPTPTPTPTPTGSVVVSVADRTVDEPAADGATASHGATVSLNRAAAAPVMVDYQFVAIDDTSTADADLPSGTATIAAGETAAALPGNVKGDALDELDERVRIVLSNARGADLIDPDAFLTIVDDAGDVPPTISVADLGHVENAAGPGAGRRHAVGALGPHGHRRLRDVRRHRARRRALRGLHGRHRDARHPGR